MSEHERHIIEYTVVFTGLMIVFGLLIFFRYDRLAILIISGAGCLFYTFWGIIHHALEGRLTKSIALEYFLIAILVFTLLLSALYL